MSNPLEGEFRREVHLTDAEIAAWNALPPASAEELEAIRRETPAERAAASNRLVREALGIPHRRRRPPIT